MYEICHAEAGGQQYPIDSYPFFFGGGEYLYSKVNQSGNIPHLNLYSG